MSVLVQRHYAWGGNPPPNALKGRHKNLQRIFRKVNHDHFCDGILARVAWSSENAEHQLWDSNVWGFIAFNHCTIVINRVLDRPFVPDFVIESVVYHEMLHAVLVLEPGSDLHCDAFQGLEALDPNHATGTAWLNKHVTDTVGHILKKNQKRLVTAFLDQHRAHRDVLYQTFAVPSRTQESRNVGSTVTVYGSHPNSGIVVCADEEGRIIFTDIKTLVARQKRKAANQGWTGPTFCSA